MKHTPNKAQEKAFERVEKAINAAQKAGLVFYGKQWELVAYTKKANNYIRESGVYDSARIIPYLSAMVLEDSGADDSISYRTDEDEQKFNP